MTGLRSPTASTAAESRTCSSCTAGRDQPQAPAVKSKIAVLPSLVELYLADLKGSLGRDTERARGLLAKLVGQITLKRDGDRLVAELRGNLPAILELEDELYNRGAGRGISSLPNIGGVLEVS